ncbi:MAG TPA: dipeptide/oligopeptide/nickel ABC transporter permease/ATP-binding protein [Acidimicrobiia bacterium]|nr:dipeptide/oligopeptide/nickel ABC transporter permease/ATP-binding protein [Acidimicrobiia bacterium]
MKNLGGHWRQASRTSRALLVAGAVITVGFAVVALLAPLLAPYGQAAHEAPQLARPSLDHIFGTTNDRFDVLSRVIFGARLAFQVVLASTAFALLIGVPLGLVSGYTGGRLDRVLVLVMDALYAFPSLLLAIVMAFALQRWIGPGVPAAALSISVIYIPQYFRVVRNHTLAVREESFVDAARAMGAPPRVIIVRYVAANVLQSVPVIFTVNAADAVLTLAGLGFLGQGPGLRTAEWGFDISRAITDVGTGAWWTSLFPGLAIVTLVTGMSLLGEGINDILNRRLRAAGMSPEGLVPGFDAEAGAAPGPAPALAAAAAEPADSVPTVGPAPAEGAGKELPRSIRAVPAGSFRTEDPAESDRSSAQNGESTPALRIEDLSVGYRSPRGLVRAVEGAGLTVAAGESVGLVGESGCGKSTLGRAVLGILPPVAERTGRVVLDGVDLTSDPEAWRQARGDRLSVVFQDPATRLDPLQRIESHFVELIRAHRPGTSKSDAARMGREALAAVGVPPARARQYPHEFSGGMRQRIMIALSVVLEPRVLIADEPTTSLDVLVEAQILDLLTELRRRLGLGVILITHNLGIVAETCDRVAVMYAGRIIEEGSVSSVFTAPRHPYTQALLSAVITLETEAPIAVPGSPPDLAGPLPGCPFAPRCPLAMSVCHEVTPADAVVAERHTAACHLYPGADRRHPSSAWEPSGRRFQLAEPPLTGTLQ